MSDQPKFNIQVLPVLQVLIQVLIPVLILGLILAPLERIDAQEFEISLAVSTLNGTAYNLLVGMAEGASDGYNPGEDLYAPPAPPTPSFYSSINYSNDSWFSCIIAADPDPVVFILELQFLITDPILIEWDLGGFTAGGEYTLRDAVGGGFIDVDMTSQDSLLVDNIAMTNLVIAIVPPPAETFIRSDVNLDGSINLADAVRLLEHLFMTVAIDCRKAADGNDDSSVNLADVIFQLAFLFNAGSAPPEPFPGCGTDPTPDPLECQVYCP